MKIPLPPKEEAQLVLLALGARSPVAAEAIDGFAERLKIAKALAVHVLGAKSLELTELLILSYVFDKTFDDTVKFYEENERNEREESPPETASSSEAFAKAVTDIMAGKIPPGFQAVRLQHVPAARHTEDGAPEFRIMRTMPDGTVVAPEGLFFDDGTECSKTGCAYHHGNPPESYVRQVLAHKIQVYGRGLELPLLNEALELLRSGDVTFTPHPRGVLVQRNRSVN